MKKIYTAVVFIFFFKLLDAQNPLVKQWDYRFGGTSSEYLHAVQQTSDGGYILGGFSLSDSSGDKSQDNWDTAANFFYQGDYWIVKTDSLGNKQWDKRFGGTGIDKFYSLQQTSDGGFILGGSSYSNFNGDKTQPNWDTITFTNDYWILKTDSLGNKQWDKRFGGTNLDELRFLQQTSDGGFILGGYSYSDIGGDKTQPNWGGSTDYWIVKTDSLGSIEWDKRFGGTDNEQFYSLQQTTDWGYILGGYSMSGIGGNKTQPSWGGADYWIVKIDSLGNKQWDKRFGGAGPDACYSLHQTSDDGYILGGYSYSDIGGDKSQPSWGLGDYWIVKTDSLGNKQWDKRFGGTDNEDDFGNIVQTSDGGYLIAGASYSPISGDKTESNLGMEQSWIVKTDSVGNKKWDKTIFTIGFDRFGYAIQTNDGCYTIANNTASGIGGYKTEPNWDTINNSWDYWIIEFCDTTVTTSITQLPNTQLPFSISPNPFTEELVVSCPEFGEIKIYDIYGRLVYEQKLQARNCKLQTVNWSNGIYFVEIITEKGRMVKKVVKQ